MLNESRNPRRWTPAQGYLIGASLMNLTRQGWTVTRALRLPNQGLSVYWEVELRRDIEAKTLVVSDGPVTREIVQGLSASSLDAA